MMELMQVVESVLKSDKVYNVKDRSGRYPVQLAREHGHSRPVHRPIRPFD